MHIPFKKFHPNAVAPEYKTSGAAGADLAASERTVCEPGKVTMVPTGIGLAIPKGHAVLLAARSSTGAKRGLMSVLGPGIIDEDYRGELKFLVSPAGDEPVVIEAGERVCQVVVVPTRVLADGTPIEGFAEQDDLGETERGSGGFGSTGNN